MINKTKVAFALHLYRTPTRGSTRAILQKRKRHGNDRIERRSNGHSNSKIATSLAGTRTVRIPSATLGCPLPRITRQSWTGLSARGNRNSVWISSRFELATQMNLDGPAV